MCKPEQTTMKYQNLNNVKMVMNKERAVGMGKDYLSKSKTRPSFTIPRKTIDIEKFTSKDSLLWLGHSTILGNIDGVSFIVDPMLSDRASPLPCIGPKRFEGSLTPINELPNIDVILITHNHYDHLDRKTIMAFHKDIKMILVPKNNAYILKKWGVEPSKIQELSWFEDVMFEGVQFSLCPTQHFSGRSLTDRDKSLWGSWVIRGKKHSVYVSGDSGYNNHFKVIGNKYGPFDIACMECGAYNDNWSEIHMTPEESVQATLDVGAKVMLPMHWAGFDLSTHAWDEPITRATNRAKEIGLTTITPMIGQDMDFEHMVTFDEWWTR